MKRLVFFIVIFLSATFARAEVDYEQDIRGIIESQLAAFQDDDGASAFAFASPSVQQIFGNPDKFMSMVKQGYPMIYRPIAYDFREFVLYKGQPTQRVQFVGGDGRSVVALYFMELQPDEHWRISGVTLVQSKEQAT